MAPALASCISIDSGYSRSVLYQIGEVMPKALETKLKKTAKRKGLSKTRSNAYVYGTLRKLGWKPKRKGK